MPKPSLRNIPEEAKKAIIQTYEVYSTDAICTVWDSPSPSLGNKSPSELWGEGEYEKVMRFLKDKLLSR